MSKKENIRLRAPAEKDRHNEPILPIPEWREVLANAVVPRSSSEEQQRGQIIISGFMVSVPASTVVNDNDEVEIRGKVYSIEGVVGDYGRVKLFYTQGVS
jgi:hypothetical protein